jgi:hypothetical protein
MSETRTTNWLGARIRSPGGGKSAAASNPAMSKEQWLQTYTARMLKVWLGREAPLGLAPAYAKWVRKDLSDFYAQPLMRAFIEETY